MKSLEPTEMNIKMKQLFSLYYITHVSRGMQSHKHVTTFITNHLGSQYDQTRWVQSPTASPKPKAPNVQSILCQWLGCPKKSIPIASKLVYNLLTGLTTYLYRVIIHLVSTTDIPVVYWYGLTAAPRKYVDPLDFFPPEIIYLAGGKFGSRSAIWSGNPARFRWEHLSSFQFKNEHLRFYIWIMAGHKTEKKRGKSIGS